MDKSDLADDPRNLRHRLEDLDFHDSQIESIVFGADDRLRRCEVIIEYYNWEGNDEDAATWQRKMLRLEFGDLWHFELNSPDLSEGWEWILEAEYDTHLERLLETELENQKTRPHYHSRLLEDSDCEYLAVKFFINSFAASLSEVRGHVLFIGADVTIEWLADPPAYERSHIPAGGKGSKKGQQGQQGQ